MSSLEALAAWLSWNAMNADGNPSDCGPQAIMHANVKRVNRSMLAKRIVDCSMLAMRIGTRRDWVCVRPLQGLLQLGFVFMQASTITLSMGVIQLLQAARR